MALWTNRARVHLADKPLDARYRLFKRGALPAASSGAATAELGRYLDARDQAALKRLTPLIEQTARRHQLEPALLRGDYRGIRLPLGAASPKGAQGLMQLMPDTAARFGVSAETVLEPRANLDTGARYLAFCWACSIAGWIWRWPPITLARAWCSGWGGFRRMKKPSNTSRRCAGCICARAGACWPMAVCAVMPWRIRKRTPTLSGSRQVMRHGQKINRQNIDLNR